MLSANIRPNRRTITMTFRLDESILNLLKSESERKDVSLNTLVDHVLKQCIEWDMYAAKAGMLPLAKPVVSTLFDKMTPQEVVELESKVGPSAIHDIALFMASRIDLESFVSWFEMRMKNSSIQLSHKSENGSHNYVIKHELGYNWSLYHKTILQLMFNQIFEKQVNISIYDTALAFQFLE
jgi:hypothetical protein